MLIEQMRAFADMNHQTREWDDVGVFYDAVNDFLRGAGEDDFRLAVGGTAAEYRVVSASSQWPDVVSAAQAALAAIEAT